MTEFGQVVRYIPAPEPVGIVFVIGVLTITELALVVTFVVELFTAGNAVLAQEFLAFVLGTALLNLAAILALYRRWFLPDVMIVKKRKPKWEDLI
ncbi:MAG: DUF7318 family protein [Thermoplasmatota archaeon]